MQAQIDSAKHTNVIANIPKYKIVIFAPLYLDSVFDNTYFKYKQGLPKFIMPGLDFVQGAQIALDSLQIDSVNIDAFIYDSKSYNQNISYLIKNKKLDSLNLIIGSVKDAEYKQLADFALSKNIPFISVTYPNDGGVTNNPFTVIMNSTLKAHCEAIFSYLLQNHGADRIYLCRKKGAQEDKVINYFKNINEQDGKPLLNIQTLNTDSSFTADFFRNILDSNRQSIIVGASLDENFANTLATACYNVYEKFPITLIGMPNWYGFAAINKKDNFEDFAIYYTSPYYNTKWDSYSKMLLSGYSKKYKSKPTDMAFKGFESVYMFTNLLVKYPTDFINHLNDKSVKVICDYNFKPVFLKKVNTPDYFENKHLYLLKLLNNNTSKVW